MFKLVYWLVRIFLFPIYRFRFEGRENLPSGACLICANHTALVDGVLVVLGLGSGGDYAVMGKRELFRIPVFGAVLRFLRVFPVRRGENDVGAIKTAFKALKEGKKLVIFPEGTRVKDGREAEVKSGAGMFALRGGVPVVPVCLPLGKKAGRRNTIVFGRPILPPELEGRRPGAEDYAEFSRRIMAAIAQMRGPAGPDCGEGGSL